MKILNFGSLNLDTVYRVPHFVWPGETLSAESVSVHPGGKGLNQSIALARAGAPVSHAGCLGTNGDELKELLRKNGVDTTWLLPCKSLQGNAVIQVTPTGSNSILLYGGSNQALTKSQITKTLKDFGEGDWLLLQNETNLLPELVKQGAKQGLNVVLNPSPFDEKIDEVDLSLVSWLIINEVEASQLSGSSDPLEVWRRLHPRYPDLSVVLTLGEDGSVLFSGDVLLRQPAFPVKAVDTTAAGDTFTGYFLASLTRGESLGECMRRATAAAALSVGKEGAADSIPVRSAVDRYLRSQA